MPYVFQVLSLLLEIRESIGTIPEPYWALFPCLVAPTLWERPGNVTPLIRLIIAFIKLGSPKIAADDKLVNIFLKLHFKIFVIIIFYFFLESNTWSFPENDCI